MPGWTGRDLVLPVEAEVLQAKALRVLGLPLLVLEGRSAQRHPMVSAARHELLGPDITAIDEMGAGQQRPGGKHRMNVLKDIPVNHRRRRGFQVRDQVRLIVVAAFGQVNFVSDPGRRPLLGVCTSAS